ncbi:MAG: GGDEF domain-containing protein [Candidatus Magasanikbacteria bacterium]
MDTSEGQRGRGEEPETQEFDMSETIARSHLENMLKDESLEDLQGYLEKIRSESKPMENLKKGILKDTIKRDIEARLKKNREDKGEGYTITQVEKEIIADHAIRFTETKIEGREDDLTGLLEKGPIREVLAQEIGEDRERDKFFNVVYIDIDDFKEINDNFGHPAGDKIIKKIARVIEDTIRESDVAASEGGDEFSVMFREISSKKNAMSAPKRLFDKLTDIDIHETIGLSDEDRRKIQKNLSVSMGSRIVSPKESLAGKPKTIASRMITQADQAELSAKQGAGSSSGKNQLRINIVDDSNENMFETVIYRGKDEEFTKEESTTEKTSVADFIKKLIESGRLEQAQKRAKDMGLDTVVMEKIEAAIERRDEAIEELENSID